MENWMFWALAILVAYCFMFGMLAILCKGTKNKKYYDKELFDSLEREAEYNRRDKNVN